MCIGQSYKCSGAWEMILNDMEKKCDTESQKKRKDMKHETCATD